MFAPGRDRRQRDRDQQRAAANRQFGHDHAYLILFGPAAARSTAIVAGLAGLVWVWFNVDHHRISLAVGALGVLCAMVYGAWFVRAGSMHSRMMQRATGQIPGSPWPWHLLAVASAMLLTAAYLIYVP